MPDDRPDYTGSIVIEDIENVTAVITITGAVSITGDITITNSTFAVTQSGDWIIASITGPVTISGAVTITSGNIAVTGSVAITNTSIAVTGSVTVSGTVSISGSVTITGSVSITGAVTITGSITAIISGTANINITSQTSNLLVDISSGYHKEFLEAEDQTDPVAQPFSWNIGSAATANTDFATRPIQNAFPKSYYIIAVGIPEGNATMKLLRDDASLETTTITAGHLGVISYQDTTVPAGSHTYAIQFSASVDACATLWVVDENLTETHTTASGSNALTHNYGDQSDVPSTLITTTDTGNIYVLVTGIASGAITLNVKRNGTTIHTWSPSGNGEWAHRLILDSDLAAGTYTYTLQSISTINHNMAIVAVSNASESTPVLLTPYLQNLNIGLDTRLPKATTPAIYNATMTNADTEYTQALPSNCKKFLIQTQDGTAFRLAYVTGKVATPTAPYLTLAANVVYWEDFIEESSQTLYFACDDAGKIIEIVAWS